MKILVEYPLKSRNSGKSNEADKGGGQWNMAVDENKCSPINHK